jgi:hypothetical protein
MMTRCRPYLNRSFDELYFMVNDRAAKALADIDNSSLFVMVLLFMSSLLMHITGLVHHEDAG